MYRNTLFSLEVIVGNDRPRSQRGEGRPSDASAAAPGTAVLCTAVQYRAGLVPCERMAYTTKDSTVLLFLRKKYRNTPSAMKTLWLSGCRLRKLLHSLKHAFC